ncbi:MAG: hypothetical protein ACRDTJ_19705, partial [Pseudonocardiaceae bacterium]
TPSERFWEETRGAEAESAPTGEPLPGNRVRPEAAVPVVVVADRSDRRGGGGLATPVLGPRSPNGAGAGGEAASSRPGEIGSRPPAQTAALPAGFSSTGGTRIADLLPPVMDPVMEPVGDRPGEEPVYVPSAVGNPHGAPRRADLEEVAGQPVWVVYRPSAGLEVGSEANWDVSDGARARTAD